MANDEHLIGGIFIVIFIMELIGLLLSFVSLGTANPAFTQFASFSTSINSTVSGITTAFSPSHTIVSAAAATGNWFVDPFISIYNGIVWLVNFIYQGVSLIYDVIAMIVLMLGLIAYTLFALPLMLITASGIIGDILGLGYGFIILFVAFKFGKIIIQYAKDIFGVITKVV